MARRVQSNRAHARYRLGDAVLGPCLQTTPQRVGGRATLWTTPKLSAYSRTGYVGALICRRLPTERQEKLHRGFLRKLELVCSRTKFCSSKKVVLGGLPRSEASLRASTTG